MFVQLCAMQQNCGGHTCDGIPPLHQNIFDEFLVCTVTADKTENHEAINNCITVSSYIYLQCANPNCSKPLSEHRSETILKSISHQVRIHT